MLGYDPNVDNGDHPASRSVGKARSAKEYIATTYIVDRRWVRSGEATLYSLTGFRGLACRATRREDYTPSSGTLHPSYMCHTYTARDRTGPADSWRRHHHLLIISAYVADETRRLRKIRERNKNPMTSSRKLFRIHVPSALLYLHHDTYQYLKSH